MRTTVVAGGELKAAMKARVLSGGRSGEVLASGKGPGGRGGDGDLDGVLHDDAAATATA